ncbi:MAG: SAVED domain-containing protein [Candidatus Heimdallarchaeota archaeon]
MSSKTKKKLTKEFSSLILAFQSNKNQFERNFNMILDKKIPLRLKQYPEGFFNAFSEIKTPGVALKHYHNLILLLFLARTDFDELTRDEIEFILKECQVDLSIDVWKKLTSHLNNDSNSLIYKIKLGKDTRLLFSSNKNLISIMERLISKNHSLEPSYDYSLALYSKSAPKDRNNVDYCLDYSGFFKEGLPTRDQWLTIEDEILTTIETIYNSHFNTNLLLRECKPHASLAFILGHSVNYFEGLELYVQQNGQYWKYKDIEENIRASVHWNLSTRYKKPKNESEINILISVSEPIIRYVEKHLQKDLMDTKFTVHFSVRPEPRENSILDQDDALRKIEAIYKYLTRLKSRIPYLKIHLFIWAPVGFIVFLGMKLSSVAIIQLYEFDQTVGNFVPNLLLDRY